MRFAPIVWLFACGSDPGEAPPTDAPAQADAPPGVEGKSQFETCIEGGGMPKSGATIDNIHGPITKITVSTHASVVILGSADQSVKQWSMNGTSGSYQSPFSRNGIGSAVGGLAHTDAMDVYGVDGAGMLHRWTLAETSSDDVVNVNAGPLVAVATNGNGSTAIVAGSDAKTRIVDLSATPSVGQPITSAATEVTAVALSNNGTVVVAGATTGDHPLVEVRSLATPDTVIAWTDATLAGKVRAVSMDRDAGILVAGGDGFVATFALGGATLEPTNLSKIPAHTSVGVQLLSGKAYFVSAGDEGTLRVFDVAAAHEAKSLTIAKPIGIGADRNGENLYTAGPDGNLHVWLCQ